MADEEEDGEIVSPDAAILDADMEESHPEFNMKPSLEKKFKPGKAKEIIKSILEEELRDKKYNAEESNELVKKLGKIIKSQVQAVTNGRYKIVVEVTLVEQRGSGIRSDLKCVWDSDADGFASHSFVSEHLICTATVFALFFYSD